MCINSISMQSVQRYSDIEKVSARSKGIRSGPRYSDLQKLTDRVNGVGLRIIGVSVAAPQPKTAEPTK